MRYFVLTILSSLMISCTATSGYYTERGQHAHADNRTSLLKRFGKPDIEVKSPRGETIFIYKTEAYRNTSQPIPPEIGVHFTPAGQPVIITRGHPTMNTRQNVITDCLSIYTMNQSGQVISVRQQGIQCR